jgi:hypothetical protein
VRAKYGAGPRIVLLVWSQLKEYNNVRQGVIAAIDASIGADPKISKFVLPEAAVDVDETGCQFHATPRTTRRYRPPHHRAVKLGW